MKNNITYLAFFVICFFALNSYSQSTEKLKQKKLNIEKEISYTNQLLEKVEKDKKKSVNYLKVLQKQIKNQNNLLATLDKEFKLIDRQIIKIKEKIYITKTDIENEEKRLKRLKEEYAKMIYNMHVNKAGRTDLIFIVSSESFNQAYKRLAYLKQYTTFRKNQTQKIQETKDFLKLKGENLLKEDGVGWGGTLRTGVLNEDASGRSTVSYSTSTVYSSFDIFNSRQIPLHDLAVYASMGWESLEPKGVQKNNGLSGFLSLTRIF